MARLYPPIVGAYWSAREESREACARRVEAYFGALRRRDPEHALWHRKVGRPPPPQVPHDAASLVDWLEPNIDGDGRVWVELGFTLMAWRMKKDPPTDRVDLTIIQGSHGTEASNLCLVTFVEQLAVSDHILQALLHAAVEAFDPDHAIVNAGDTLKAAYEAASAAQDRGERAHFYDSLALRRYQRGVGFSTGTAVQKP